MASDLTHPMPLYGSRYPPYSGTVDSAGRRPPADEDGRGSFGPVLVVLAVISFLAVSACIAGRLCGRRQSKSSSSSRGEQQPGGGTAAHADAEKGSGVMQNPAAVMRPVPSSRATVHDVDDDVFEIKLCAPVKPPAGRHGGSGGDDGGGSAQPRPPPPRAMTLGVPRQYAAAAAAAVAGFRRAPPASGGAAVRLTHPQVLGRSNGGAPFAHGSRVDN